MDKIILSLGALLLSLSTDTTQNCVSSIKHVTIFHFYFAEKLKSVTMQKYPRDIRSMQGLSIDTVQGILWKVIVESL